MPIHDWTRVEAGIFHDFHHAWIGEIRRQLNGGLLPRPYYALAEQIAGGIGPDVLTLQGPAQDSNGVPTDSSSVATITAAPPKVQMVVQTEIDEYAQKQRSLTIRHTSNHRIIAIIEILSPGNKSSRDAMRALLDKVLSALANGIHLLLIDLLPPGPRDAHGIHAAVWEKLTGIAQPAPGDKPLTLAAYSAGAVKTAYVQTVAVGDSLPLMPLFLTREEYVNTPLELTYQAAWDGVPYFYREILEGPAA